MEGWEKKHERSAEIYPQKQLVFGVYASHFHRLGLYHPLSVIQHHGSNACEDSKRHAGSLCQQGTTP